MNGHIKQNAILYFVLIGVFSLQWLISMNKLTHV